MKGKKQRNLPETVFQAEAGSLLGGGLLFSGLRVKCLSILVLMLVLSAGLLSAEESVRFMWHSQDEAVRWYRWQEGSEDEGKWTVVDSSVTTVTLPSLGSTVFYVQASYDGVNWSSSGSTEYKAEKTGERFSLRFSISPYTLALYRFYNGYGTSSSKTRTSSVYGAGAGVEFSLPLLSWLSIFSELGCDFVLKKETVIPGARSVYYPQTGIGLDFTHTITEGSDVFAGLCAGVMGHINGNRANITPYFAVRMGFEYALSDDIALGASSRAEFALLKSKQSIMDSMTLLIEPVVLTLTYSF